MESGRSSTVGFPEIRIGIIKKGPLSSINGGELGSGTRTIEHPGLTKNWVSVSWHYMVTGLDQPFGQAPFFPIFSICSVALDPHPPRIHCHFAFETSLLRSNPEVLAACLGPRQPSRTARDIVMEGYS